MEINFFGNVASENLELEQLDMVTAFLIFLIEARLIIYVERPTGYKQGVSLVFHFLRHLYGLKQSPRE